MAILNSLNVHNFPIFQLILMKLVSKFMVHRALFDKTYLSLELLSPSIYKYIFFGCVGSCLIYCMNTWVQHAFCSACVCVCVGERDLHTYSF